MGGWRPQSILSWDRIQSWLKEMKTLRLMQARLGPESL